MCPEILATIAELGRFLIPSVMVVLGWMVIHRLSSARDRDKSRREMLAKSADSLGESVDKLFSSARDYHTRERDSNVEIGIKMALQDMSIRTVALSDLCKKSKELVSCHSSMIGLRKAITSKHFEDEHVAPLLATDLLIQDVATEVLRVKQAFLKLKHSQFPPE